MPFLCLLKALFKNSSHLPLRQSFASSSLLRCSSHSIIRPQPTTSSLSNQLILPSPAPQLEVAAIAAHHACPNPARLLGSLTTPHSQVKMQPGTRGFSVVSWDSQPRTLTPEEEDEKLKQILDALGVKDQRMDAPFDEEAMLAGENQSALYSEEDVRRHHRRPPRPDRLIYPVHTEVKRRVTRKTKWIVKQLRTLIGVDVHKTLRQWVETMYPQRSDWLDLLKDFEKDDVKSILFQIYDFAFLEDTFEAETIDFVKVILAYVNVDQYDDAERIWKIMKDKEITPDMVAFSAVLDLYTKTKQLDKAREIFREMRLHGLIPDIGACSLLMEAYCKLNQPDEAEKLMMEVKAEKMSIKIDTYCSLIRAYGRKRQTEDSSRIVAMLELESPNIKLLSAVMDAYILSNQREKGESALGGILIAGLEPLDESVALLVTELEKDNLFDKAVDIMLMMESRALRPGVKTLTAFIGWFDKLGLVEEAEKVFQEIKRKGGRIECKAYAAMYATYARASLVEKVRSMEKVASDEQVILTDWAFEQMMDGLIAGGLLEEAQMMQNRMLSQGFTPSEEIERALLRLQTSP